MHIIDAYSEYVDEIREQEFVKFYLCSYAIFNRLNYLDEKP